MQVLSIDLVVLNIKMRNMVLNHVLVPIQITKIKPVSKGHRREKIVVYPRKRALCPCRCAGVPVCPGSTRLQSSYCGLWLELKTEENQTPSKHLVRHGDTQDLGLLFLNSANANSVFKM